MRMIVAVLAACLLTGCATATTDRPRLTPLDSGLTQPCQRPPVMPSTAKTKGLSERQTVDLIGRYHGALSDCARRQAAVVRIYESRDSKIGGDQWMK